MDKEKWEKIPDCDKHYEISNYGNIRIYENSEYINISQWVSSTGYKYACIRAGGKQKTIRVHRYVCKAFNKSNYSGKEVNHKNGNKLDNRSTNLEWCTRSENMKHAHKNGLIDFSGEGHPRCKVTDDEVEKIRMMIKENNISQRDIAKMFGITRQHVTNLKFNRSRVKK